MTSKNEIRDDSFNYLLGKTIVNINIEKYGEDDSDVGNVDVGNVMIFTLNNGEKYKLYHQQDCCESVYIEDICGDLDDLLNTPILLAEAVANDDEDNEYLRWTFYKLSTVKGSVTIRWCGQSEYYSVEVTFMRVC